MPHSFFSPLKISTSFRNPDTFPMIAGIANFIAISALILTTIIGTSSSAFAQVETVGGDCTVGPRAAFWEQSSICPASTHLWQRPAFQFGPAVAACGDNTVGMLQWAGASLQLCGGQISGWVPIADASGSNAFLGTALGATNPHRIGDLTTGLVSLAASTVGVVTAGVERLRVTATGSVGIGTTNPTELLTVGDSSAAINKIAVVNTSAGTAALAEVSVRNGTGVTDALRLQTLSTGYTTSGGFVQDSGIIQAGANLSGGLSIIVNSANPMRFYTGGYADANERMRIDSSGKVGIGTTGPSAKLDIGGLGQFGAGINVRGAQGTTTTITNSFEWGHGNTAGYGSTIGFNYSGGQPWIAFSGEAGTTANTFRTRGIRSTIIYGDLAGGLQIGNVATAAATDNQSFVPLFNIQNTGSVGIGTATPTNKLHVEGTGGGSAGLYLNSAVPSAPSYTLYNNAGVLTWGGSSILLSTSTMGSGILLGTAVGATNPQRTGDATTGLVSLAASTVGIVTAGVEALRVTATGSVGIGTTSPSALLQVVHSGSSYNVITVGDTTSIGSNTSMYLRTSGSGYIGTGSAGGITRITSNGFSADTGQGISVLAGGNVGIGTTGPGSKLDVYSGALQLSSAYLDINRDGYANSGINWYGQAYNAWAEYMSPTGAGMGPRGVLTAPAGTYVTGWALRNYIENAAGYGWTFESAANTTTPAVKFEIRSSDGLFHSYGAGVVDGSLSVGSTVNAVTGYKVNGAATSGNVLVGDGTNFVSGTLSGGSVTGAALTKTDDTNVTLTLGGTPATALLRAASLTLGWTGQLAVGRGGSGAATLTGVLKGNGASAFTAMTGTANYAARWTDANTIGTGILYDNGTNVGIGTATPNGRFEVTTSTDGIVFRQASDNTQIIQTYIDNTWASRTTYAGGCCNLLNIQTEAGQLTLGNAITGGSTTINGPVTFSGSVAATTFTGTVTAPIYAGAVSGSSYGSIKVSGTTGSYAGIYYSSAAGSVGGMFDTAGNGGDYDPTTGWHFYWNRANSSLGIGGSTTNASYKLYVNGNTYGAGTANFTGTVTAPTFSGTATSLANFTSNPNRTDGNDYSLAGRTTGIYAIAGAGTNGPGATYLSLIHAANSTDVAFQIAGGYVSDAMYFRGTSALQSGTSYTPWRTVIHSGNIGSQSVANATNNVLKAGDTMSGNLNFNNYGIGVVGVYSDVRYQNVFSMGAAYTPSADGTSLSNLYGIAWTHSNIGGQSKAGLGHQALFVSAGTTRTAIGDGIWTSGTVTAPTFSGSLSGNATSATTATNATNVTTTINGLRHQHYNRGDPHGTDGTNPTYDTGAMGRSVQGPNEVFANGRAGFIDVWGGSGYPAGLSHMQGFQSMHYNGGYGIQILGQYNTDDVYVRQATAGTLRGWRKLLDSGNYTSYSPSLTGTGASGTWGISISGNADTVDSQHFAWSNADNNPTYLWGANSNGSSFLAARGAMSVNYATSAGSASTATTSTYSTYLWSTSHSGSYYISNAWDGTYWNLTSNHGSPVKVGYATNAGTATNQSGGTVSATTGTFSGALTVAGYPDFNNGEIEIQGTQSSKAPFVRFHRPAEEYGQIRYGTDATHDQVFYFRNMNANSLARISIATPVSANDGATKAYVDAAAGGGGSWKITTYSTAGSYTWTLPTPAPSDVQVYVVGGGGGGGGGYSGGGRGGGGGGAAILHERNLPVTGNLSVVVGTGGAGGAGGGGWGSDGGSSSITGTGIYLVASGGGGGSPGGSSYHGNGRAGGSISSFSGGTGGSSGSGAGNGTCGYDICSGGGGEYGGSYNGGSVAFAYQFSVGTPGIDMGGGGASYGNGGVVGVAGTMGGGGGGGSNGGTTTGGAGGAGIVTIFYRN